MTPDGMQRLLNAAKWDAGAVRDDLQSYVAEHLGEPDGVLVVDDTGLMKGDQVGRRLKAIQRHRRAHRKLPDRCLPRLRQQERSHPGRAGELYLPRSWTEDQSRCDEAAVDHGIPFTTKPVLGLKMLDRVMGTQVSPARWVTADEAYGKDSKFRLWLQQHRLGCVLAVPCDQKIPTETGSSRADYLAQHAPEQAWKQRS